MSVDSSKGSRSIFAVPTGPDSPVAALALSLALALALALAACAPAPSARNEFQASQSKTGETAPDGKSFTGAGPATTLETLKAQTDDSKSGNENREFAKSILGAAIDRSAQDRLRILVGLREIGRLTFDLSKADIEKGSPVVAKNTSDEASPYELRVQCQDSKGNAVPGLACPVAILSLRTKSPLRETKAKVILRTQPTNVIAKSNKAELKSPTLQRILSKFKTPQVRTLQSFEVAWGASGFELLLQDEELCPAGRLVETNDLDEPLRMNCRGHNTAEISGRMIGNTTKGELFLEFSWNQKRALIPDIDENLYLMITRVKEPKAPTPTTTPTTTPTAPVAGGPATSSAPSTSPSGGSPVASGAPSSPTVDTANDTDDDDDSLLVPLAGQPTESAPATSQGPRAQDDKALATSGWLIPIDPNNRSTRIWNADRKHAAIASRIRTITSKSSSLLSNFARYFPASRERVVDIIKANGLPAEVAYITLGESDFFRTPGYPIRIGMDGEVGPWQIMLGTAKSLNMYAVKTNGVGKNGTFDPCDDRANLYLSTNAAARYLKRLFDMFPSDPKLAIMAYNRGEGGVQGYVNSIGSSMNGKKSRLDEIKALGINYWTVRKFNMGTTGSIEYVERFVAIHHAFLEMDPVAPDPNQKPWVATAQCRR